MVKVIDIEELLQLGGGLVFGGILAYATFLLVAAGKIIDDANQSRRKAIAVAVLSSLVLAMIAAAPSRVRNWNPSPANAGTDERDPRDLVVSISPWRHAGETGVFSFCVLLYGIINSDKRNRKGF